MKEIEQLLLQVDDDYLIGLTNKGTVKRAWKDLEKTTISYNDYENITIEECSVSLASPLGESKCSCPSRSICKHIIMAVLKAAADIKEQSRDLLDSSKQVEESSKKDDLKQIGDTGAVLEKEGSIKVNENNTSIEKSKEHKELLEFPIEKAVKVIKEKSLERFIASLKRSRLPEIEETSIVTVNLQDMNAKVKLLEPIEHSSCTCHKKELCEHKAIAILYYQFFKQVLTINKLQEFLPDEKIFDISAAGNTIEKVIETIEQQLTAGLSRTSDSVMESMERMAILCHNAGLADFERNFRSLKEEYELYFKRSSAFQIERLMSSLTLVYNKAMELKKTEDPEKIKRLAGEFRSDYDYIGELMLTGVGRRHFHSKTGYEGEIYYFLEETSKEWYTFTNARPIFYDKKIRTYNKAAVPWELPLTMDKFAETRLHLQNAKAALGNRLSSSNETKAEIMGKSILNTSIIEPYYYDNFEKMFIQKFEKNFGKQLLEIDKLVFVRAYAWEEPIFDEIRQYFTMKLYDKDKNAMYMEVRYSKEEKYTIRYLERLVKYLKKRNLEFPCFWGIVYLEDGFMKLYPIDYFENLV